MPRSKEPVRVIVVLADLTVGAPFHDTSSRHLSLPSRIRSVASAWFHYETAARGEVRQHNLVAAPPGHQRSRTSRSPDSTLLMVSRSRLPTYPARCNRLSTVRTWDTFTTDSFESPEIPLGIRTFPGRLASPVFEVMMRPTTVRIALLLKVSRCSTRNGCRSPGSEPSGGGRSIHQMSPRLSLGASSDDSRFFNVTAHVPPSALPGPRFGRGADRAPCPPERTRR